MASGQEDASPGSAEIDRSVDIDASAEELVRDPLDSLVTWVQTLYEASSTGDVEEVSLLQLTRGSILLQVMGSISQKPVAQPILDRPKDQTTALTRLKNLFTLIQSIQKFYKDVLGQIVVCRLPDCIALAKAVDQAQADTKRLDIPWPGEMQQLLLLLLGCAVQCPQREDFINNIKLLDVGVQHVIVACIRQITDDLGSLWPLEWHDYRRIPELQREGAFAALVNHVQSLADERDKYLQEAVNAYQTLAVKASNAISEGRDDHDAPDGGKNVAPVLPSSATSGGSLEYHHLLVELADVKGRLRRLRQELEEKSEVTLELNEELETTKDTLSKLRSENSSLTQEARAAKILQDELDVVREKAARADQLEADVRGYREKLADVEFFKSRVEELREENKVLIETKDLLEDQLESLRSRQEQMMQLEQEMVHHRSQIHQLQMEKEANQVRIEELMEENSRLLLCNRSQADESNGMLVELDRLRHGADQNTSLSEELTSDTLTHLRRLELENQRLLSLIDQLKEQQVNEVNKKVTDLEQEKSRLSTKLTQFRELAEKETTKCVDKEAELKEANSVIHQLKEDLEGVKQLHARQVDENEREKAHLGELVEILRLREEQTKDTRLKQVQEDNKKLLEANQKLKAEFSRLQFDRQQLEKLTERLKSSSEKNNDLEDANNRLKSENEELAKNLTAFREVCSKHDKLEEDYTKLQVDYSKLEKILDSMKASTKKFDTIREEHAALALQNAQLRRKVENLEAMALNQTSHHQETKESLSWEISQLKATLQATKVERSKFDEMELDLLRLKGENQKLSTLIEASSRKLDDLEKEKADLEVENERMDKSIRNFKKTVTEMVELERKNAELESSNEKFVKEKASLVKEVAKLKEKAETKETTLEEVSTKITSLESEKRSLFVQLESANNENVKLVNLEKDFVEVKQEKEMLDQMIVTLREELMLQKMQAGNLEQKAALEVENTTLQAQASSLSSQNSHLQETNAQLQVEKQQMASEVEKRKLREKSLMDDYEALQKLHEQLSCDYESLQKEQTNLKSSNRIMIRDFKTLQENFEQASRSQEKLNVMKAALEDEKEALRQDAKALANLRAEHSRLKDDFRSLFAANKRLKDEYKTMQSDHKALRSDNSLLRLKQTELQGQLDSTQHKISTLELQRAKLAQQCDVLSSLNSTLDEERRQLMTQVSLLLTQYHDLLTQTLQDRNQFHEEEKNYVEKMNDLRRQKEKLEEKIMEQYRRMESVSRRKGFGSALVRRVRKAGSEIMQKVPRANSRSRERGTTRKSSFQLHVPNHGTSDATDSQDSASVASTGGSGSSGDDLLADLCRDDDKTDQLFDSSSVFNASSSTTGAVVNHHRHSMPCLPTGASSSSLGSLSGERKSESVCNPEPPPPPVVELSLGRVGTRRAVYYSDDRDSSKNGSEHVPSPKVSRSRGHGKPRLPDPADLDSDKNSGSFNGGSMMPSGARQSPIGMARSTPEPSTRTSGDESTLSRAASPSPDGACATSTPIRATPAALSVKPTVPLPIRQINRLPTIPAKSSLNSFSALRASLKPIPKPGEQGQQQQQQPLTPTSSSKPLPGGARPNGSNNNNNENAGEKKGENSVWYEYGCV